MPHMLQSIIRGIVADQPDMEVVGELSERAELEAMVEQTSAAFVIMGRDSPDATEGFRTLLTRQPPVRILAITGEGKAASLYELRPQRIPIGELSASRLVSVIRGAGHVLADDHAKKAGDEDSASDLD
jgi:DNA-binding NarL/FixJ family response regulator